MKIILSLFVIVISLMSFSASSLEKVNGNLLNQMSIVILEVKQLNQICLQIRKEETTIY